MRHLCGLGQITCCHPSTTEEAGDRHARTKGWGARAESDEPDIIKGPHDRRAVAPGDPQHRPQHHVHTAQGCEQPHLLSEEPAAPLDTLPA